MEPAATSSASVFSPATSVASSSSVMQPRPGEPADVRDRARQVVRRQLAIHLDRSRERGDPLVVRLAEPTTPDPHPSSVGSWPPILPGCDGSFLA